MNDDGPDGIDASYLNVWPSFSDLMLALVLMLVMVMGGILASAVDTDAVMKKQHSLATSEVFAKKNLARVDHGSNDVEWTGTEARSIRFVVDSNDPFLQRITFSNGLLFDSDSVHIKTDGRELLRIVGDGILARVGDIEQIQIQGHADTRPRRPHNLGLASARANEVFLFLQEQVGIDPVRDRMSSASFGEYAPIGRPVGRRYSQAELDEANATDSLMQRNRRIEMLLFYRQGSPPR